MARKLKVDMTGVESYVRCEEGQHVAVIKKVTEDEAKESGNDMLVVQFEVIKGSSAGAIVYNNFVLTEKALWRLKQLLEAVGIKADGKVAIDLDKLEGKKLIIEVNHEEYNKQMRARLAECLPLSAGKKKDKDEDDEDDVDDVDDDNDDEEEEEQPKKKPKKPAKKQQDDDDDEDDDEDEKPKNKKKPEKKPEKKKPKKRDDGDDDDEWEDD